MIFVGAHQNLFLLCAWGQKAKYVYFLQSGLVEAELIELNKKYPELSQFYIRQLERSYVQKEQKEVEPVFFQN